MLHCLRTLWWLTLIVNITESRKRKGQEHTCEDFLEYIYYSGKIHLECNWNNLEQVQIQGNLREKYFAYSACLFNMLTWWVLEFICPVLLPVSTSIGMGSADCLAFQWRWKTNSSPEIFQNLSSRLGLLRHPASRTKQIPDSHQLLFGGHHWWTTLTISCKPL